jgi:hypothetical protein
MYRPFDLVDVCFYWSLSGSNASNEHLLQLHDAGSSIRNYYEAGKEIHNSQKTQQLIPVFTKAYIRISSEIHEFIVYFHNQFRCVRIVAKTVY